MPEDVTEGAAGTSGAPSGNGNGAASDGGGGGVSGDGGMPRVQSTAGTADLPSPEVGGPAAGVEKRGAEEDAAPEGEPLAKRRRALSVHFEDLPGEEAPGAGEGGAN